MRRDEAEFALLLSGSETVSGVGYTEREIEREMCFVLCCFVW